MVCDTCIRVQRKDHVLYWLGTILRAEEGPENTITKHGVIDENTKSRKINSAVDVKTAFLQTLLSE